MGRSRNRLRLLTGSVAAPLSSGAGPNLFRFVETGVSGGIVFWLEGGGSNDMFVVLASA